MRARMITDDPRTTLRNIGSATVTMVMTSRRPDRDEHIWTVSPEGTVWIAPRQQRQLYELTFAGDTIRAFDIDSETGRTRCITRRLGLVPSRYRRRRIDLGSAR